MNKNTLPTILVKVLSKSRVNNVHSEFFDKLFVVNLKSPLLGAFLMQTDYLTNKYRDKLLTYSRPTL